jgi:signal-transduction protein with cAMP-binding, CBS, and nucleotidyltransferase domain
MLVGELVEKKGASPIFTVDECISAQDALEIMAKMNVNSLLVHRGAVIVGEFFERDFARTVILKGQNLLKNRVGEVMSRDMAFVEFGMSVDRCFETMVKNGIRDLLVVKDGRYLGPLSIEEVVGNLIENRDFIIDQLNKFITGSQFEAKLTESINLHKVS